MIVGLIAYNNHLKNKDYRLYKQAVDEIYKCFKKYDRVIEAQVEFNDSAVDSIDRHEEALKIIVNYIKSKESNI